MDNRTFKEKITDKLLLLYIIHKANEHGYNKGKTKLQKFIFVIEKTMNDKKVKGLNYDIIKFHHGPYSHQLEQDFKDLQKNEIFARELMGLTDKGNKILNHCSGVLERNQYIVRVINSMIENLSRKSLDSILTMIYNATIKLPDGRIMKIADIPENTPMINKLRETEAKEKLNIPNKWIETLDIMFDKEASDSLDKALKMSANIPLM